MKLNLGCGYNKKDGYVNVDKDEGCSPDLCFDITRADWPVDTSVIEEVLAEHILEHLEGTEPYLTFWKELYRVCQHGAEIRIEVPHWRHDTFFHDPTHTRPITPVGIAMFDQERNFQDLMSKGRETKLGLICQIDIELKGVNYIYDNLSGTPEVCQYLAKVVKPARYK